jgi:hypothetical protein
MNLAEMAVASKRLSAWESADRLPFQMFTIFVALVLLGTVPVLAFKVPPLVDYPSHLARMWIIAKIQHDPFLQRFYEIHWRAIPDLAMDFLVPPLVGSLGIWLAGKIFIILTLLLMASGAAALSWQIHKKFSPVLLLVPILLYNSMFLFGFLNFLFSSALALWGIAIAVRLRATARLWRQLISAGFLLVLYFCHLYGVGLYGLVLLSMEAAEWRKARLSLRDCVLSAAAFVVPFIPVLALLLISATHRRQSDMAFSISGKFTGVQFALGGYTWTSGLMLALLLVVFLTLGRRKLVAPPSLFWLLGIGVTVWLAMPSRVLGSAFADARLPLLLLVVACSLLYCRLNRREAAFFCCIVAVATSIRYIETTRIWRQQAAAFAQLEDSVGHLPLGSRILVATTKARPAPGADPTGKDAYTLVDFSFVHMASVAVIERSAFETLEFTMPTGQILQVHPELLAMKPTEGMPAYISLVVSETPDLRQPDPSARRYWIGWRRNFDAIYLLDAPLGTPSPSPDMDLIYQGGQFQLYRVHSIGTPD